MTPTVWGGAMDGAAARALLLVGAALVVLAVPAWRLALTQGEPLTPILLDGVDQALAELGNDVSDATHGSRLVDANHRLLAAIDTFETRLDESSPLLAAALPAVQPTLLQWGRVGNETVYAGSRADGGWLLLRTGYDHLVGPPFLDPEVLERRRRDTPSWRAEIEPDPRPAILALHEALRARQIRLVVLPVPTKPAIHPESLGAPPDERANPSLEGFLAGLREDGVEVFDPAPALRQLAGEGTSAYLRTDSHWSPAAVDLVAQRLAQHLEGLGVLGPVDQVWERRPAEHRGYGDLWRALRLRANASIYTVSPVTEEGIETLEVSSWDDRLWAPERGAQVLLLGDSFSAVYSDPELHWGRAAGLAEQLSFHLERQVDRIAIQDGSAAQVRERLAEDQGRLRHTRVVVYQFATRELSVGDWRHVDWRRIDWGPATAQSARATAKSWAPRESEFSRKSWRSPQQTRFSRHP